VYVVLKADRKIYLLQRKTGKLGEGLGKTTGWVHRTTMKKRGVIEMDGCAYKEVSDKGLVIERNGQSELLDVDTVVICAGQESLRDLYEACKDDVRRTFLLQCCERGLLNS
jgi:2,4-dienoyl-CoA reductase (NADPH2)